MTERPPLNTFRTCPAATGEAQPGTPCTTYPDTAHRCHHQRPAHIVHTCTCGYAWHSATSPRKT